MTWGIRDCDAASRWNTRALCTGLALVLAGGMAQPVLARGVPVVRSSQVKAAIVAPLSVLKLQDMSFGRIVPSPQGGTVTIDAVTSACIVTGTIREVGTCKYAQFTGLGAKNMNARISLVSPNSLTGPGTAMPFDQLVLGNNNTVNLSGNTNSNGNGVGLTQGVGNASRYKIVSSSGIYLLNIGGRLTVNPNQAPGVYTGTFQITVQYN